MNSIEEGKHPSDEKIRNLLDDTERLLATILITNNFVNVTIIMLCNFFFMNVFQFHSVIAEFLILTVVLTFLLLLFGEIMPKIYSAQKHWHFAVLQLPVSWHAVPYSIRYHQYWYAPLRFLTSILCVKIIIYQ